MSEPLYIVEFTAPACYLYASIDKDLANRIAQRWGNVLDTGMEALSKKWRNDLRGFLISAPTSSASASAAQLVMSILSKNDPILSADLKKNMDPWSAAQCFVLPLLAWGLRQPWAQDIDIARTMERWFLLKPPASCVVHPEQLPLDMLQLAFAHEGRMTPAEYARAMGALFEGLVRSLASTKDFSWQTACIDLTVNTLRVAEKSDRRFHVEQYLNILDLKVQCELNTTKRDELLVALAQSRLSIDTKLRILERTGVAWRIEGVQRAIEPLWPAPEHERVAALPFFKAIDNEPGLKPYMAQENQRMVKAYCPRIFPLLELGAEQEVWNDRSLLLRAVEQFSGPAPDVLGIDSTAFDV